MADNPIRSARGRWVLPPLLVLLAALVGACQDGPETRPGSVYYRVPEGSRLVQEVALSVPAGRATLHIQGGRPVAGVDDMEPHCIFELSTVREEPQPVAPDEYLVVKVRRSTNDFGGLPAPMYAEVGGGGDSSLPTKLFYKTELYLRSPRQPRVLKLTCQANQMTASGLLFARHLTVGEIRSTLQGLFRLYLPGEGESPGR